MRIGLFLSREEGAVSEVVDVGALASNYSHLTTVKVYDNLAGASNRLDLLSEIGREELEGIVLAGPSTKYYHRDLSGKLFIDSIEEAGINTNKVGFANLKEQVAFPHKGDREGATAKAKALIDVAIEKVRLRHPIKTIEVAPRKSVAIIGTTAGAIVAAQRFLEQDFKVHVLAKTSEISKTQDHWEAMDLTQGYVETHPKADFHFDCTITDVYGWCGDYTIEFEQDGNTHDINIGGIIIAVGGDRGWTARLQPLVQIDTDDDGLFRTEDPLTLPVQTTDPGKMIIPFRHANSETLGFEIASADSAVLGLEAVLNKKEISHHVTVSEVDEDLCGACGSCVRTCAFRASHIDPVKQVSVIDPRRCRGCGNCVVACPTQARDLLTNPNDYLLSAIRILGQTPRLDTVKILAILCNACGYSAADEAGYIAKKFPDLGYPASVLPLRVECGGRVNSEYTLHAFTCGFDGVVIVRCRHGHCHNIIGNRDMDGRINLFRTVIGSLGIDTERLRVVDISPKQGDVFIAEINRFVEEIKERVGGGLKCLS